MGEWFELTMPVRSWLQTNMMLSTRSFTKGLAAGTLAVDEIDFNPDRSEPCAPGPCPAVERPFNPQNAVADRSASADWARLF